MADRHVADIAGHLATLGLKARLTKLGTRETWRRNEVHADNGFNIAAFGLETAIRGIKIGAYRPDLVIFDDIDEKTDTLEMVLKKELFIKDSILNAMASKRKAVLFVENLVHQGSMMNKMVNQTADWLMTRNIPVIEPAIFGLKWEYRKNPDSGISRPVITDGTPSWEGQPIEKCQDLLDLIGIDSFLTECQHEIHRGGELAFPMFEGEDFVSPGIDGRHVVGQLDIQSYWNFFGCLDYGYNAFFCFILFAVDEYGKKYCIDVIKRRLITIDIQARMVKEKFLEYNLPLDTTYYYDPAMASSSADHMNSDKTQISYFHAEGLTHAIPGDIGGGDKLKQRIKGWDALRTQLVQKPEQIVFVKGRTYELTKQIERAVFSKTKTEDVDDERSDVYPGHSDCINALRYGIAKHMQLADKPKTPEVLAAEYEKKRAALFWKETTDYIESSKNGDVKYDDQDEGVT